MSDTKSTLGSHLVSNFHIQYYDKKIKRRFKKRYLFCQIAVVAFHNLFKPQASMISFNTNIQFSYISVEHIYPKKYFKKNIAGKMLRYLFMVISFYRNVIKLSVKITRVTRT